MSGSFSDWCPSLNWCCGVVFVLFFSFSILRISSFLLFQTVLGSALFPASFIVCLFVRAKHLHVTRGKRGDLIRLLVNRLRRWSWRPHRAHYSGTRWLHRCIISGMSTTADGVMGPARVHGTIWEHPTWLQSGNADSWIVCTQKAVMGQVGCLCELLCLAH